MLFRKIVKMFKKGSVCVTGLRGTGKDVIMGNVAVRRKIPYVSNLNYGGTCYPFDYNEIDLKNSYDDILKCTPNKYVWPYEEGTDLYISDVGVYFPSQYCNQLNRDYQSFPYYMALSRQISKNNVHINVQNLNRAWDKIREQSDIYIRCLWCKVLFAKKNKITGFKTGGIVIQKITIYDKYEACLNRVKPCRVKIPLLANREMRLRYQMHIDQFEEKNGKVKNAYLIYINKSSHDTYYFKSFFESGKKKGDCYVI